MKQINLTALMENNGINIDRKEILGMEFIKVGNKYMINNSNGIIVDEAEKIKLENKELVIKDVESNQCQKETTKKISKNKKRLEEINENIEETEPIKE
jgi:hypothetical protein